MAGPVDRRPLSERWRPTRLSELIGNASARRELAAWADAWAEEGHPARRAVILVGPPGVGKTSAAVALAAERGWVLVEMNASEARNQGAIERVAGRASITRTLDAGPGTGPRKRTLVLLDEADCLSGGRTTEAARRPVETVSLRAFLEGRYRTVEALNAAWGLTEGRKGRRFEEWAGVPRSPGNAGWAKLPAARRDLDDWRDAGRVEETGDRGGLGAIARLLRSTRQPLVLTVNDDRPLGRSSASFRTAARTIRFGPIAPSEIADRLRAICSAEALAVPPETLATIVERSHGDLRAALNDLEAIAPLSDPTAQRALLSGRDQVSDFAGVTEELLSRPRYYRSVELRDRLDAPPDDLLPWVEENIPWFAPDAVHREAALRRLAAADLLLSRARRWRVYGLWSYAGEILSGGVSLAIRERPAVGQGSAAFPRFLGAMGASRGARAARDALADKLARRVHLSRRKSRLETLPFAEALFESVARAPRSATGRSVARALVAELELTPDELAGLLGGDVSPALLQQLLPSEPGDGEPDEAEAPGEGSATPRGGSGRGANQRRLGDWGGG